MLPDSIVKTANLTTSYVKQRDKLTIICIAEFCYVLMNVGANYSLIIGSIFENCLSYYFIYPLSVLYLSCSFSFVNCNSFGQAQGAITCFYKRWVLNIRYFRKHELANNVCPIAALNSCKNLHCVLFLKISLTTGCNGTLLLALLRFFCMMKRALRPGVVFNLEHFLIYKFSFPLLTY